MFPNDDICNPDAAKLAAQRIFKKYRNRSQKDQSGLGKSQVNNLMKAAYDAINMPYDPNEEDVLSFMGVFDSNGEGKIELKNLQEMAVKYLCGTEALLKQLTISKTKQQQSEVKKEYSVQTKSNKKMQEFSKDINSIKTQQPIIQVSKKKPLTIEVQAEQQQSYQHKIYTPSSAFKIPPINSFYSPKVRTSFKDALSSANTDATSLKSQINTPKQKLTQDEIVNRGKEIFSNYSDKTKKGIIQNQAGKVLMETYEIFGKKNFNPSTEDIKIWMKLCDKNKDSIVQWEDYEYFLIRTFERQSKNQK